MTASSPPASRRTEADVRLEIAEIRSRSVGEVESELRRRKRAAYGRRDELRTALLDLARYVDRAAAVHGEAFVLEALKMSEGELVELCQDPLKGLAL